MMHLRDDIISEVDEREDSMSYNAKASPSKKGPLVGNYAMMTP